VADDVVFLVNPASANGSTGRRWPDIVRRAAAAGVAGKAHVSERPGQVSELAARAAAEGAPVVVAVGGDGTVHEAVNGLLRSGSGRTELAVLPRGTGGDFARTHRIPTDVDRALAVVRDGRPRRIDVGRARFRASDGSHAEAYFAQFAGAGISGAIAGRANASSKALGGRVSFIVATVAVFARWNSEDVTVQIDDEQWRGRMFEVLVTIGEHAAGGMRVTPGASPADELFDVLLIGDVSKADFVVTFPKIYRGRHLAHPKVDVVRGRRVSVEAATALPIALDGEQPGTTPAAFEIVPGALPVRVPAG
jgi:YegS/Rv2252/BmrU family lipid kinase